MNISVGSSEYLGEPVLCRLGQAVAVGRNRSGELELYFASNGNPATFHAVGLIEGHVRFSSDLPGSDVVWAMAIGSDGQVYFSGTRDGVLYRYSPEVRGVEPLVAFADGPFVWDLQPGPDGTIVGATYPRSKLFEYDFAAERLTDLGRMSEEEQYARGLAIKADSVYAGIGSTLRLIRLDRRTGAKVELPIDGYSGKKGFIDRIWAIKDTLFLSVNQQEILVYDETNRRILTSLPRAGFIVSSPDDEDACYFVSDALLCRYEPRDKDVVTLCSMPGINSSTKIKLMQWMEFSHSEWKELSARLVSVDKNQLDYTETDTDVRQADTGIQSRHVLVIVSCYADIWYYDPQTNKLLHRELDIPVKPLSIQTIEADEDGLLYIGGYHRGLCLYNPEEKRAIAQVPSFPQIEGIGLLNRNVYFGTYTKANVYVYDKSKPLQAMPDDRMSEANPRLAFPIGHGQDRPFTFASGDNQLFIGTIPDYGLHSGALTVYSEPEQEWTVYPSIAPNLSIVGLAYKDGLLYGGTSIWGGLGQEPVEAVAHLFIWDTATREVVKRFVPEIPALDMPPCMIGELSAGPDGNIWGAVDGTLFVMEPISGKVLRSLRVCESKYMGKFRPVYLRWGDDGLLYTALGRKLVVVDPATLDYEIVDDGPLSIMTLGGDGHIYYGNGSRLYRIAVTRKDPSAI